MNTQRITAIALRVIAIWLLIQLVLNISGVIMLLASVEQYQQQIIPAYAYIGLIGSILFVGLVAVYLMYRLSRSVLNGTSAEQGTDISKDSQKYLLQLAGVFFVVTSLAYLPRSLSFLVGSSGVSTANILWPSGLLFQFLVGIWLASSASFWCGVLQKLRGRA